MWRVVSSHTIKLKIIWNDERTHGTAQAFLVAIEPIEPSFT